MEVLVCLLPYLIGLLVYNDKKKKLVLRHIRLSLLIN